MGRNRGKKKNSSESNLAPGVGDRDQACGEHAMDHVMEDRLMDSLSENAPDKAPEDELLTRVKKVMMNSSTDTYPELKDVCYELLGDYNKLKGKLAQIRTDMKDLVKEHTSQMKDLLRENTSLKKDKDTVTKFLTKVGVFPYLRMKFQLYSATWEVEWRQTNFQIKDTDIPANLYNQTKETFKEHWERWDGILRESSAPGAIRFRRNMLSTFRGCTIKAVAKYVALLICILNNSTHSPLGFEVFAFLTDTEQLIGALQEWDVKDPDLLNVVRIFEETTTTDIPAL